MSNQLSKILSNGLLAGGLLIGAISPVLAGEIQVDATKKYQTIDGFGTCLISWTDPMRDWYRKPTSVQTYTEELRFNILRCNLTGDGTIGPTDDPEMINFKDPAFAANDRRTPVFIQFATDALKRNPKFKVIGTVWSPPGWMKENNSIVDVESNGINGRTYEMDKGGKKISATNRVRKDRYPHFAKWLVEMVKYYKASGVPMYAVSCANEPQFSQPFESCVWTADDLATITAMVGERLKKEGLGNVKLFGPETMTGFNWENGPNYAYTQAMRENKKAFAAMGFWASHGYADGVVPDVSQNSSAKFWSLIEHDAKPYWMTEGGTGGHDWPEPVSEKGVGIAIHNALVAGNASAFVPWQYAEDSRTEHNLMPLAGPSKKTYVVRQYSRYIPAGAVRVDATPAFGEVAASAFVFGKQNADWTVVLLNHGSEQQQLTIKLHGLKAKQIHTITTSATQDADMQSLQSDDAHIAVTVPGPGIVTITTLND